MVAPLSMLSHERVQCYLVRILEEGGVTWPRIFLIILKGFIFTFQAICLPPKADFDDGNSSKGFIVVVIIDS